MYCWPAAANQHRFDKVSKLLDGPAHQRPRVRSTLARSNKRRSRAFCRRQVAGIQATTRYSRGFLGSFFCRFWLTCTTTARRTSARRLSQTGRCVRSRCPVDVATALASAHLAPAWLCKMNQNHIAKSFNYKILRNHSGSRQGAEAWPSFCYYLGHAHFVITFCSCSDFVGCLLDRNLST